MIGNVLQFTSIPAKIDISSVSAKLSSTYIPSKLDIEKTPAELEIHSKNITCDIDSSECMAEEGHKTTDMLIKEYADQGLQSLQEYAHNLAVEGDMLIHAGKGEDVYKELAGQYLEADIQEPGIKFIPSERPKITWNKNEIQTEWNPSKTVCNWDTSQWSDIHMERYGNVTITETQKPEIHFEYTGNPDGYHILDKIV